MSPFGAEQQKVREGVKGDHKRRAVALGSESAVCQSAKNQ